MMRDKRKSEKYFENYINYEQLRISKRKEKLIATSDPIKSSRISSSLFLYQMNLLIASFSSGENAETLQCLLDDACVTASKIDKLTYSDALALLSFSIMVRSDTSVRPIISRFRGLFEGDKLLCGFASYIECGEASWGTGYRFPAVYSGLDAFFSAKTVEAKEEALLAYLESWYNKCKDCAWFNTLDNPNDVYFGYWCFEAAALAKIYNLNETRLCTNEYFPMM